MNLGPRPNYYDLLKAIAILLMIIDHIGYFLFPEMTILRIIGRISMPLFLLLVGYNRSGTISRRLIVSAILVDGTMRMYDSYYGYNYTLSILWSIIIVKLIHQLIQKYKIPDIQVLPITLGTIIVLLGLNGWLYSVIDYGTLAIIIGLCGLITRLAISTTQKIASYLTLIIVMLVYFVKQIEVFHINYYLPLLAIFATIRGRLVRILPRTNSSYRHSRYGPLILRWSSYSLQIYIIHIVILAIVSRIWGR